MTQAYVLDYMTGDGTFKFSFPYNPNVVDQIKAVSGARWAGVSKTWRLPKPPTARRPEHENQASVA